MDPTSICIICSWNYLSSLLCCSSNFTRFSSNSSNNLSFSFNASETVFTTLETDPQLFLLLLFRFFPLLPKLQTGVADLLLLGSEDILTAATALVPLSSTFSKLLSLSTASSQPSKSSSFPSTTSVSFAVLRTKGG